jgi:hypothetical protein
MSLFIQPQFKKNIKGKIVKQVVEVDAGGDEKFPGLEFTDGSILVVQRDPEGNGGGFMSLEKDGKALGCAG